MGSSSSTHSSSSTGYKFTGKQNVYVQVHQYYTHSGAHWQTINSTYKYFNPTNSSCKYKSGSTTKKKHKPTQSYYNCQGNLHTVDGALASINIDSKDISANYKLMVVGSPCVNYELDTILYKKKPKHINVSYNKNHY